ncbi:MAG: hypothetical protein AAGE52_29665 [Myxococcota bacterium]
MRYLLWAGILACGSQSAPAPQANSATAASEDPNNANSEGSGLACPIVPMRLVATAAGFSSTVARLDDSGVVRVSPLGPLQLDTRGCIFGQISSRNDVWAEITPRATVWTSREEVALTGDQVSNAHTLSSEGVVLSLRPGSEGTELAHFEGYAPEARCAATLMLHVWMATVPSMADPEELPPPNDSVCGDRRP